MNTTVCDQLAEAVAAALVESLDEADQHAAEHGAGQVADAAEHSGGEGDQAELDAGVVVVVWVCTYMSAGGAGQRAAEGEGERDGPVDVDAHQPGAVLVLGHRPHGLAQLGPLDDVGHQQQQRDGDADHHEAPVRRSRPPMVNPPRGRRWAASSAPSR